MNGWDAKPLKSRVILFGTPRIYWERNKSNHSIFLSTVLLLSSSLAQYNITVERNEREIRTTTAIPLTSRNCARRCSKRFVFATRCGPSGHQTSRRARETPVFPGGRWRLKTRRTAECSSGARRPPTEPRTTAAVPRPSPQRTARPVCPRPTARLRRSRRAAHPRPRRSAGLRSTLGAGSATVPPSPRCPRRSCRRACPWTGRTSRSPRPGSETPSRPLRRDRGRPPAVPTTVPRVSARWSDRLRRRTGRASPATGPPRAIRAGSFQPAATWTSGTRPASTSRRRRRSAVTVYTILISFTRIVGTYNVWGLRGSSSEWRTLRWNSHFPRPQKHSNYAQPA